MSNQEAPMMGIKWCREEEKSDLFVEEIDSKVNFAEDDLYRLSCHECGKVVVKLSRRRCGLFMRCGKENL